MNTLATRSHRNGIDVDVIRWRNAVFVIFALNGLTFASYLGRLPQIRDLLHASVEKVSLLALGLSVGSLIGLVLSSAVVPKLGAQRTLRITFPCLTLAMVFAAGAAQLGSFVGAVLMLAVVGVVFGLIDVAMNVSGADNERELGRTVMPIYHASFSVGTVLGAGIAAAAQYLSIPLLWHLIAINVVVLVGGIAVLPRVCDVNHHTDHTLPPRAERMKVWFEPITIVIGVLVLGMALAEGSANDWLALAMVEDRGVSKTMGTVTYAVFVAAMTIGRFAGVTILDRFGRVPVIRGCALLSVLGLSLVIFAPLPARYFGVILWGLGASLGFPVGISAAADDPRHAAARVSVVSTIGYLAFLAGPPLIGFLGQRATLLRALVVVLVAVVISGLVAGAARERRDAQIQTPGS